MSTAAKGSAIVGLGHYAPERRVTNAELEVRLGLEPGWIERRTGIVARRYAADGEALTDMAVKAGAMALDVAGIDKSTVALVAARDQHAGPPLAAIGTPIGRAAGTARVRAASIWLGPVRAFSMPSCWPTASCARRARPFSSSPPTSSRAASTRRSGRARFSLPTPQAPSCWRRRRAGTGLLGAKLAADGSGYDLIKIAAGGSRRPFAPDTALEDTLMTIPDGKAVFTKAVEMMVTTSREALVRAGLGIADIDLFVPHQANARIMAAVAHQLGVPEAKMVSTIAEFANSSAATIPLSLSLAAKQERLTPGAKVLMCAAGAGLTGAAVVFAL